MIRNVDIFFNKNLASAAIAYYPELSDTQVESQKGKIFLLVFVNYILN